MSQPTPRKDAKLFRCGGGGWGDRISWTKWPDRVHGWKTPLPRDGDVLLCPMESGRDAIFLFSGVKPCGDPPDMFFSGVTAVAYSDELEWPLPQEQDGDPMGGYRAKEALDAAREIIRHRS